jgi:hypothetical protein
MAIRSYRDSNGRGVRGRMPKRQNDFEVKAKTRLFRKPLATQLFAYHIG